MKTKRERMPAKDRPEVDLTVEIRKVEEADGAGMEKFPLCLLCFIIRINRFVSGADTFA